MFTLTLKWILVILHIITAAAWFGLGLRLAGQARTVVEKGLRGLADDAARSVRLMNIFVVLTFVFAAGAFFVGGGFGAYGPQYHTSLLLIVVLVGLQFFVIRPGWAGLRNGLSEGEASAESARKRVAMGVGIGHLIWLVLLVLMFWDNFSVAFQA